eukprot:TRINITY_DN11330_c0_g1_i1.p1 TRINITY_DN11330_c0_g1~~TRINITY_DN11330_c0_g1_i1.p1  ORF type:complete len:402 (+),score=65.61 TRINITY_DN11330_c0_g1_i1:32-1237(+)
MRRFGARVCVVTSVLGPQRGRQSFVLWPLLNFQRRAISTSHINFGQDKNEEESFGEIRDILGDLRKIPHDENVPGTNGNKRAPANHFRGKGGKKVDYDDYSDEEDNPDDQGDNDLDIYSDFAILDEMVKEDTPEEKSRMLYTLDRWDEIPEEDPQKLEFYMFNMERKVENDDLLEDTAAQDVLLDAYLRQDNDNTTNVRQFFDDLGVRIVDFLPICIFRHNFTFKDVLEEMNKIEKNPQAVYEYYLNKAISLRSSECATLLVHDMRMKGLKLPSVETCNHILRTCAANGDVRMAKRLLYNMMFSVPGTSIETESERRLNVRSMLKEGNDEELANISKQLAIPPNRESFRLLNVTMHARRAILDGKQQRVGTVFDQNMELNTLYHNAWKLFTTGNSEFPLII